MCLAFLPWEHIHPILNVHLSLLWEVITIKLTFTESEGRLILKLSCTLSLVSVKFNLFNLKGLSSEMFIDTNGE